MSFKTALVKGHDNDTRLGAGRAHLVGDLMQTVFPILFRCVCKSCKITHISIALPK